MDRIDKPAAIISSTGRTGTLFFARFLHSVLDNATVVHEPDVFHFSPRKGKGLAGAVRQLRTAGAFNFFIRKYLGGWSVIKLSDRRMRCQIGDDAARRRLLELRQSFVQRRPTSCYVESNCGYYGLMDLLPGVFSHHRSCFIIRDGRDWVRSKVNWGEMYGKGWPRRLIAHNWPRGDQFPDDPLASNWSSLGRFEKCCWAWTKFNGFAIDLLEANPEARLFYFEDIFRSEGRLKNMIGLLEHILSHTGIPMPQREKILEWQSRRVHSSRKVFPAWPEWSRTQKATFREICGPLMKRLGYDTDVYPITEMKAGE